MEENKPERQTGNKEKKERRTTIKNKKGRENICSKKWKNKQKK